MIRLKYTRIRDFNELFEFAQKKLGITRKELARQISEKTGWKSSTVSSKMTHIRDDSLNMTEERYIIFMAVHELLSEEKNK